jgi:hypothetical protein
MSKFKAYLSYILSPVCIKHKGKVIMAHEPNRDSSENINLTGYPFALNGFDEISVNGDRYGIFLAYKIESIYSDPEDTAFSINTICPKLTEISKLIITEDKLNYIRTAKPGIAESLNLYCLDADSLCEIIFPQICDNYIYNLEYDELHDIVKFNVCIELATNNKHLRKTMVALKYYAVNGEVHLITIT